MSRKVRTAHKRENAQTKCNSSTTDGIHPSLEVLSDTERRKKSGKDLRMLLTPCVWYNSQPWRALKRVNNSWGSPLPVQMQASLNKTSWSSKRTPPPLSTTDNIHLRPDGLAKHGVIVAHLKLWRCTEKKHEVIDFPIKCHQWFSQTSPLTFKEFTAVDSVLIMWKGGGWRWGLCMGAMYAVPPPYTDFALQR